VFQELMPLLAQRTLLLVVSRVGADEIHRIKSGEDDQNSALLTPLSVGGGTPKELDEGRRSHRPY